MEGIADYNYQRFRYQRFIKFCNQHDIGYTLPSPLDNDVEIYHEKTGTLKFSADQGVNRIVSTLEKLLK